MMRSAVLSADSARSGSLPKGRFGSFGSDSHHMGSKASHLTAPRRPNTPKDLRVIPRGTLSQPETAMAKEGKAESGLAADPTQPFIDDLGRFANGVGAQIGQLGAF